MKKISYSLLSLLLVLTTACNMDEHPYGVTAETLAENQKGAEQLVTGVYAIFWDNWMMEQTYEAWMDQDHDHVGAPAWAISKAGSGDVTGHYAYNTENDLWSSFYRMINRANKAIESFESTGLYKTDKTVGQLYGECLFMRAFAYFHLVRMYGPVPLRLTSQTEEDCPRTDVSIVYDQITNDLETSLSYLTYQSEGYVGSWGHADKTAGELLLARVYCTMGSCATADAGSTTMIVDIKGTDTELACDPVDGTEGINASACYSRAKELCDDIINRRGIDFDLMPDFLHLWGNGNRKNKEIVWGVNSAADQDFQNAGLNYYMTPAPWGGAGAWMYMSDNLYNQFESQDDRIVDGIWHYYMTAYGATQKWVSYPSNSDVYNYANMPEAYKKYRDSFNASYTKGTACMRKWFDGDLNSTEFFSARHQYVEQDIPLLRFAEAYLLRAEAEVELGNNTAAMQDVNVIRSRANASTYDATNMTKVQARSLVLKERALELAQEFNRKFDLLRWGIYLNVMNTTQFINCGGTNRSLVRTKKNLLYAIPTSEIAANPSMGGKNNEGY